MNREAKNLSVILGEILTPKETKINTIRIIPYQMIGHLCVGHLFGRPAVSYQVVSRNGNLSEELFLF